MPVSYPLKTKLLLASIPVSTLLFLLLSLLLTSTTTVPPQSNHVHLSLKAQQQQLLDVAHHHCQDTLHHSSCVSALTTIPSLAAKTLPQIISKLVRRTTLEVNYSASNCTGLLRRRYRLLDPPQRLALQDCLELFDSTLAQLRLTLADLSNSTATARHFYDIETLLSAAITNTYTCRDGFVYASSATSVKVRPDDIESRLYHVAHLVSNSLAMVKRLPRRTKAKKSGGGRDQDRDLLLEGYGAVRGGFPTWVSGKDRRLLQAPVNSTTAFDLVVAKDGTGNFTTIGEAVAAAPNNSATRFVIYIKGGAYFENVEVDRSKTNLMFVGDGIGKTVVKASRNVVDGWTTFRSATVAVVGNGFIARDMTFENAAGPSKHQAVALRSGSDLSAFYRCSFVAYQDTLYVHSLRQFYRDCDVYGTVDFIFGNAAVVFQNCNLYARKPDPNQKNIFTAQGREDPNQNTGISIQNCKIAAAADLIPVQTTFKNYLGRPWKNYSRTVVMQSNVGDLIDPAGWLEWDGDFALSTLYYGEYRNRGPGSNTTARVKWPGYRVINSSAEASQFTPGAFIQGDQWLPQTSIPYTSSLF